MRRTVASAFLLASPFLLASRGFAQTGPKLLVRPSEPVRTEPPVPAAPPARRTAAPAHPAQPATIQVGAIDWRFVDPRAVVIGGMDLEALMKSSTVQGIIEQTAAQFPGGAAAYQAAAGQLMGSGGIRRILFSASQAAHGVAAVALLTGKVDERQLAQWAQGKMVARRLDLENVLLGEEGPALEAALLRLRTPAAPETALLRQARTLAARNDFWLVGSGSLLSQTPLSQSPLSQSPLSQSPLSQTNGMANTLKSVALGLRVRDDLDVDVNVDAGSAAKALEMVQSVSQARDQFPEGATVAANLEGTSAHVHFRMEGDRLKKLAADTVAGRMTPEIQKTIAEMALRSTASAPAPARPQKAVIYGLEDGPREVPLSRP